MHCSIRISPHLHFFDYFEVVKALVSHGANVDLGNINGTTPLFLAAQEGYLKIIEYLLDNGAAVDTRKMKRCHSM